MGLPVDVPAAVQVVADAGVAFVCPALGTVVQTVRAGMPFKTVYGSINLAVGSVNVIVDFSEDGVTFFGAVTFPVGPAPDDCPYETDIVAKFYRISVTDLVGGSSGTLSGFARMS